MLCGLWTRMACPNYEVVRIWTELLRPGFQPRTGVTTALNTGAWRALFKARLDKAEWQWQDKNDTNTTENEQGTDTQGTNSIYWWEFQLPWLRHKGPSSSLTEHPKNWPLPGIMIIGYRTWAWQNCILPFWKFLSLLKVQVRTEDPIMKHTEVSDRFLSLCWDLRLCVFGSTHLILFQRNWNFQLFQLLFARLRLSLMLSSFFCYSLLNLLLLSRGDILEMIFFPLFKNIRSKRTWIMSFLSLF